MCSGMNPLISSLSSDRCRFITDVGVFVLAVAFRCPLQLRFGAVAESLKLIYIRGISTMIQLHLAEACPKGMYNVV